MHLEIDWFSKAKILLEWPWPGGKIHYQSLFCSENTPQLSTKRCTEKLERAASIKERDRDTESITAKLLCFILFKF